MTQPGQAATGAGTPPSFVIAPFRWTAAETWSAGWVTLSRGRQVATGVMLAAVPILLGLAPLAAADRDRPGLVDRVVDQALIGLAFSLVLAVALAVALLPWAVRAGSRGVQGWIVTPAGVAPQGAASVLLPWTRFSEVVVAPAAVRLRREAQSPLMFPRRVLGEAGTAAVVAWAQAREVQVTWRCAPLDVVAGSLAVGPLAIGSLAATSPHAVPPAAVPLPADQPDQESDQESGEEPGREPESSVVLTGVTAGYGAYLRYRWLEASGLSVAVRGLIAVVYALAGADLLLGGLSAGDPAGAGVGLLAIGLAAMTTAWVPAATLRVSRQPATVVIDATGVRSQRGSQVSFMPWTTVNRARVGRRLLGLRTRAGVGLVPLRLVTKEELARILTWARACGTPVVEAAAWGRELRAVPDWEAGGSAASAVSAAPVSWASPSGDFDGVHVTWEMPLPGQLAMTRYANRRTRVLGALIVAAMAALAGVSAHSPVTAGVLFVVACAPYELMLINVSRKARGTATLDVGPSGLMLQGTRAASSHPWSDFTALRLRSSMLALHWSTRTCPLVLPRRQFTEEQVQLLVGFAEAAGVPVRGR